MAYSLDYHYKDTPPVRVCVCVLMSKHATVIVVKAFPRQHTRYDGSHLTRREDNVTPANSAMAMTTKELDKLTWRYAVFMPSYQCSYR